MDKWTLQHLSWVLNIKRGESAHAVTKLNLEYKFGPNYLASDPFPTERHPTKKKAANFENIWTEKIKHFGETVTAWYIFCLPNHVKNTEKPVDRHMSRTLLNLRKNGPMRRSRSRISCWIQIVQAASPQIGWFLSGRMVFQINIKFKTTKEKAPVPGTCRLLSTGLYDEELLSYVNRLSAQCLSKQFTYNQRQNQVSGSDCW